MDEHRIGLHPVVRRVWAPRGQRPSAPVQPRYEWLYVAAFVHPESGRTSWWLLPKIDAQVFAEVLRAFAQEQNAGTGKHILLVLDGAGWHSAAAVEPPQGIELVFQPPYSPEVQPAEHLWEIADEALVNHCFDTLADLEEALARRCCALAEQTERIMRRTLFAWWPITGRSAPL